MMMVAANNFNTRRLVLSLYLLWMAVPLGLFGQGSAIPIWENSTHNYSATPVASYDRITNIGKISPGRDGSIYINPYESTIPPLRLGNTGIKKIVPDSGIKHSTNDFSDVIEVQDTTYIFSLHHITLAKGGHIIKTIPAHSITNAMQGRNGLFYVDARDYSNIARAKNHDLYHIVGGEAQKIATVGTLYGNLIQANDSVYFVNVHTHTHATAHEITPHGLGKAYALPPRWQWISYLNDWDNYGYFNNTHYYTVRSGHTDSIGLDFIGNANAYSIKGTDPLFTSVSQDRKFVYQLHPDGSTTLLGNTSQGSNVTYTHYCPHTHSVYQATGTTLNRLFLYFRTYPRIFNQTNANSIFTLAQDSRDRVWIGSYQGNMTAIDGHTITESKFTAVQWMPSHLRHRDKLLFFGEGYKGNFWFSDVDDYTAAIQDSVICFYAYKALNGQVYVGTARNGLWTCSEEDLDKSPIPFRKITKNGLDQINILTITEDRSGTIWGASGSKVFAYDPDTEAVHVRDGTTNETEIVGSMASLTDRHGTLWMGDTKGQLFFLPAQDNKSTHADFVRIDHPFFDKHKAISFLQQWGDYLIIGCADKVLLLDLKAWYGEQQIRVRYVHEYELNIGTRAGQNTILTDQRDSTVWFATSDMLYQWDIRGWLDLPIHTVEPRIILTDHTHTDTLSNAKNNRTLKPTDNTFSLSVDYQTWDNLPRLLSIAFVHGNDSLSFDPPSYRHDYQFANLGPGHYMLHVRVFQQDGTYTTHLYPIHIKDFFYKTWWFILATLTLISLIIFMVFYQSNQLNLQRKRVAQLNTMSLSNQLRPHFILNVLNTIGADFKPNSRAEQVISALGESIDIMYDYSQSDKFYHSFAKEWQLAQRIIDIQKMMYIPDLQVHLENEETIPTDFKIPLGLLHIPIENALIHGLRNKETGIPILRIRFDRHNGSYIIEITDNGIGMEKSNTLQNKRTKGTGLSNLRQVIQLINKGNPQAITWHTRSDGNGTTVQITIKETIYYDHF